MRPYVRLYILAVVVFLLLIGAARLAFDRLSERSMILPLRTDSRQTELDKNYERGARAILQRFKEADASGETAGLAVAATSARDELLALTVPTAYKDFHLDLVIAFNRLATGYGGDTESLEAGRLMLREATSRYTWAAL